MFQLLLSLCLAADPATCAERWLPGPAAPDAPACHATAAARAAAWAQDHPALRPGGWRCVATADLPRLPTSDLGHGIHVHAGAPALPDATNRGEIANLSFVIGTEGVAVIDAGASRAQGEALLAAIRNLTDLPVTFLILTHMHPDHSFGASVFHEAGAVIVGAARLGPALDQRADTYMRSYTAQIGAQAMIGTRLVGPDAPVTGTRDLSLGPDHTLRLTAVDTAHTDNDLAVLHLETGTLFAGDLIVQDLLPTLDGSLNGWLAYLDTAQPGVRRVVPGHGPAPLDWPGAADPARDYLSALRAETRAAIAAGTPMSAAITRRDGPAAHRWQGHDISHPRNLSAAYKELEWE